MVLFVLHPQSIDYYYSSWKFTRETRYAIIKWVSIEKKVYCAKFIILEYV